MKKLTKTDKDKIAVNVYSATGILVGLYYLYVCISNLLDRNFILSSYEVVLCILGVAIPSILVGFCIYLLINKKVNKLLVIIFSIILLVVAISQLFVNKVSIIHDFYYLFDHRFKYSLYCFCLLPIIYLLVTRKLYK